MLETMGNMCLLFCPPSANASCQKDAGAVRSAVWHPLDSLSYPWSHGFGDPYPRESCLCRGRQKTVLRGLESQSTYHLVLFCCELILQYFFNGLASHSDKHSHPVPQLLALYNAESSPVLVGGHFDAFNASPACPAKLQIFSFVASLACVRDQSSVNRWGNEPIACGSCKNEGWQLKWCRGCG